MVVAWQLPPVLTMKEGNLSNQLGVNVELGLSDEIACNSYPVATTLSNETKAVAMIPPMTAAIVNHRKGYGRVMLSEKKD